MSLSAALIAHEVRTQARSLRFRVFAVLYAVLGSLPAALAALRVPRLNYAVGSATFAAEVEAFVPLLTALFAFVVSLDGIYRERDEGSWSTLALSGLTNTGYLLRRWLALQAVILPFTAIPFAAAAGLAVSSGGLSSLTAAPFLAPWLLHNLPLAVAASSFALALGTVTGSAINASLLGAGITVLFPILANLVLARWGYALHPTTWTDASSWRLGIGRLTLAFKGENWARLFPLPASESGFDLGTFAEQQLAAGAFLFALAVGCLGIAILYLRRTRPDISPWRVRQDHPLRTYLRLVSRLREGCRPDPAPPRTDRLAVALALLAAAALLALLLVRAHHYRGLALERYAAETSGGPTTPAGILPGRWRVQGRIGPDASVDLQVSAELRNQGTEPCRRLAFQLNPELAVEATEADGGRLAVSRSWDRLTIDLGRPIAPGGRRELRFRLTGRPASLFFDLGSTASSSREMAFARLMRRQLGAHFSRDLYDFSQTYTVPAISGRRVELSADDLTPVLRYQSWALLTGEEVPHETFFPSADLELSLTAAPGLFVADSCGGAVGGDGGGEGGTGRLESRCRLPLTDLAVLGGRHQRLRDKAGEAAGMTVAAFPSHAQPGGPAELHLGLLSTGQRLIHEAWPSLGSLGRTVVLEWPESDVHARHIPSYFRDDQAPEESPVRVIGNLVLLRERDLIAERVLETEPLVAEVVAARLARRRNLRPEDAFLFRQLFRVLALERLGLGPAQGAVVGPLRPGSENVVRTPPADPWDYQYWNNRFPAIVVALEKRMGAEELRETIDELLSASGGPASTQELLDRLARRGGESTKRLLDDLLVAGFLPEPVLEGVVFRRAGSGWRATGQVRNLGDGEALCRVVLTTDLAPVETVIRAGTGESAAFDLASPHRPQAVLLDPGQECQRLVRNGVPRDRVYFREGSS